MLEVFHKSFILPCMFLRLGPFFNCRQSFHNKVHFQRQLLQGRAHTHTPIEQHRTAMNSMEHSSYPKMPEAKGICQSSPPITVTMCMCGLVNSIVSSLDVSLCFRRFQTSTTVVQPGRTSCIEQASTASKSRYMMPARALSLPASVQKT